MVVSKVVARGADGFAVCVAVSPTLGSWRARAVLAPQFGLADAARSVLGPLLRAALPHWHRHRVVGYGLLLSPATLLVV